MGRLSPFGPEGKRQTGTMPSCPTRKPPRRARAPVRPDGAPVRPDGEGGEPVQAPRLHLPVSRDLRRLPFHVRLRPPRGQPAQEREGRLVEGDGAAADRRGRPGRVHPVAPGGMGGIRPFGQLHRPAGRLPSVPSAMAGRQDRRGLPIVRVDRVHRGPGVQPHVQDACRPLGGRGCGRLPASGDGPGDVHQLHERGPDHQEEAAVRDRPGGQVVPQRDHPAELRVPDPRVRADGDGVLRPSRRGASSGSSTGWTSGSAGISTWASPRTSCGCATTMPTSCPTTRRPPPTWSSCFPGAGTSWRASPTGPTSTSRPTPPRRASGSTTSIPPPMSGTCPTSSSRRPEPPGR